jgi:hypothetical protein
LCKPIKSTGFKLHTDSLKSIKKFTSDSADLSAFLREFVASVNVSQISLSQAEANFLTFFEEPVRSQVENIT